MKILFFDHTSVQLKEKLKSLGLNCYSENINEHNNKDIIGIIVRNHIVDETLINKYPNLKFIARAGSGIENINQKYCDQKNIKIIRSPEGNSDAVAEYCLGSLLTLTRNIAKANNEIKNNLWIREKNRTHELKNKTIGIIGYGNTGKAFAEILKNFNITDLAYDKYKQNFSDSYAKEVNLKTIFSETDVLSVHINYNANNNYFINYDFLKSFKNPIYIINTSRGKCLDTNALIKLTKNKKIIGAVLDVIEYEESDFKKLNLKNIQNFEFLKKSNKIIMTPHIAGITHESKKEIQDVLLNKISEFIL